jgi:hypothetical protein
MVQLLDNSDGAEEVRNIALFSSKAPSIIREAVQCGAVHPASMAGILHYHATAPCTSFQAAFAPPTPQIVPPPPGFNPKAQ